MISPEVGRQIEDIRASFAQLQPGEMAMLRPRVTRVIRKLNAMDEPIPQHLEQIEAELDADADDDFFDNMPV